MKCIACNNELPNVRVSLGYKRCVNCSDVETYGCVDIVYHKTGNTIQIMSKEQAAHVNKFKRRGFGTMLRGGTKTNTYNPKGSTKRSGCSTAFVGSAADFDKIGKEAMMLFEMKGIDAVHTYIDKAVKNYDINNKQAFQLKRIFEAL